MHNFHLNYLAFAFLLVLFNSSCLASSKGTYDKKFGELIIAIPDTCQDTNNPLKGGDVFRCRGGLSTINSSLIERDIIIDLRIRKWESCSAHMEEILSANDEYGEVIDHKIYSLKHLNINEISYFSHVDESKTITNLYYVNNSDKDLCAQVTTFIPIEIRLSSGVISLIRMPGYKYNDIGGSI